MITIPLFTFLIIYCVFLIIFSIFFFINVGYLISTGSISTASTAITFFVLIFALIVVGATLFALSNTNWGQTITLFNSDWFGDTITGTNTF